MSPLGRPLRVRRNTPLPSAAELPRRIFAPRTSQVVQQGGKFFHRLLNREFSLQHPIDWALSQYAPTTHLQRLAFHYHECLESLPFEAGRDIVLDWIDHNPPWQPGYWKDCWNSYAISIRCVCWLQWLAEHRDSLTSNELEKILGSLVEQVRFLTRNLETDICGNHLIKNIKCLLWAGVCFEGREALQWFALGKRLLHRELKVQLLPDGMHFELSPAYHCQVFADLLECAMVLPEAERNSLIKRLQPSAQVIVDLTHPDGLISLMSDGGLHMAYLPAECLAAFEQLGGEPVEAREHFAFPDAGYFGLRTKRTYLVIDCGPPCAEALPAHGHGDILSFEWDVDGQRIIVDPGVYEYEPGEIRRRNRSAASHNTVTVEDRDQCEFIGSFRVGHRAQVKVECLDLDAVGELQLTGSHNGYSRGRDAAIHRRIFRANNGGVEIADEILGAIGEVVVARLLLNDNVKIVNAGKAGMLLSLNGTRIRVKAPSSIEANQVAWSPDFGVIYDTRLLQISLGQAPIAGSLQLVVLT